MPPVEHRGRHRQLEVLDHPRAGDPERLAGLVVRPHAAVLTQRGADDRRGLSFSALLPNGLDSQSIAFFRTPGMLPLYSGVTTSAASAAAAAARRATTGSATSSLSMSSL